MKKALLLSLVSLTALPAHAALVFADNFNAPDTGNLDLSSQTGRRSGLDTAIQVRSSRVQHGILSNQLNFLNAGTGRIRFHNDPDNDVGTAGTWHDWATGSAAAQILSDGGLRVEFDWITDNTTSDNWVAFNAGHSSEAFPEPGFRVNEGSNDFGILFRFNGDHQEFDNGVNVFTSGDLPATLGLRHISIDYTFTSFADGTPVGISASVDGVNVYTGNFTWDGNGGSLYMELETLQNTLIDNLSISTIPEPAVSGLGLLAVAGLALRRRRA